MWEHTERERERANGLSIATLENMMEKVEGRVHRGIMRKCRTRFVLDENVGGRGRNQRKKSYFPNEMDMHGATVRLSPPFEYIHDRCEVLVFLNHRPLGWVK